MINPVYKKELKMMARSKQMPIYIVIYNAVFASVALIVIYCITLFVQNEGTSAYSYMTLFYELLMLLECILLCIFVPSVAGGSIAGERERQTLDILLSTRMTPFTIIRGKLYSCVSMALLLMVSSLPVLASALMYGGISLTDIYQSILYVCFFTILVGIIGIYCSCRFKKTTTATIATYGILIGATVGSGLIVILLIVAFSMQRGLVDAGASWIIYFWLINPAVTFYNMLSQQFSQISFVSDFCNGMRMNRQILNHWTFISITLQTGISVLLLFASTRKLKKANFL